MGVELNTDFQNAAKQDAAAFDEVMYNTVTDSMKNSFFLEKSGKVGFFLRTAVLRQDVQQTPEKLQFFWRLLNILSSFPNSSHTVETN